MLILVLILQPLPLPSLLLLLVLPFRAMMLSLTPPRAGDILAEVAYSTRFAGAARALWLWSVFVVRYRARWGLRSWHRCLAVWNSARIYFIIAGDGVVRSGWRNYIPRVLLFKWVQCDKHLDGQAGQGSAYLLRRQGGRRVGELM